MLESENAQEEAQRLIADLTTNENKEEDNTMTFADMKKNEFSAISEEIHKQTGVFVLKDNKESCYIEFVYNGYLWYLQASEFYPFTDDNYPGKWCYMVSAIAGINEKAQLTYFESYTGFENLKINRPCKNPLTTGQKINTLLTNEESISNAVIRQQGGNREKEIIKTGAFMAKGETWNDQHKVIEILSITPDQDGYYPGFEIDIVTGSICG